MKKLNYLPDRLLPVMLVVFLLGVTVVSVSFTDQGAIKQQERSPKHIPDDVQKIFNNSCGKCHNQGGSGVALARLNITRWEYYLPDKQVTKATAICKAISSEKMPPKSFLKKNPQAALTDEQKTLICNWSK